MPSSEREQLAAEHPDAWIPSSPGEAITGEVTDLNIAHSNVSGHNYPILTVADEHGIEVKVHCFATALHNEVFMKRPVPGEHVMIVYHGQGEAKIKGQSPPEIYRLRIQGRTPEQYGRMYDLLQPRGQGIPALNPPAPPSQSAPADQAALTT